jgi:hypothetical protein
VRGSGGRIPARLLRRWSGIAALPWQNSRREKVKGVAEVKEGLGKGRNGRDASYCTAIISSSQTSF